MDKPDIDKKVKVSMSWTVTCATWLEHYLKLVCTDS
jgi:hypothetical protein